MIDTVINKHVKHFGHQPTAQYFSPASLLVLGDMSDVLKGKVLTFALNKGLFAAVHPREDHHLSVVLDFHEKPVSFTIDLSNPLTDDSSIYQRLIVSILRKLQYEGYRVKKGLNISVTASKSLPKNLGFHAAYETLFMLVFVKQNQLKLSDSKQARYAYEAEKSLGELSSNIAHQFTCYFAKKHHFLLLDTKTMTHENIPYQSTNLPGLMIFVNRPKFILNADIVERLKAIQKATEAIKQIRAITALTDLTFTDFNRLKKHIKPQHRAYAEHVMFEQERIEQAVEFLKDQDYIMFTDTLEQSQNSLKHLYGISNQYYEDILKQMYDVNTIGARIGNIGYEQIIIAYFEKDRVPKNFDAFRKHFYAHYKKDLDIQPIVTGDHLTAIKK